MSLLFVFGTLKSGFPLHDRALRGARKLCDCHTVERFPMLVAGPWFAPMMLNEPGTGHQVHGELYDVDPVRLATIDLLESVPEPGNLRVHIEVQTPDGQTVSAFAYVKSAVMAQPAHTELLDRYMDQRFVPFEKRPTNANAVPAAASSVHGDSSTGANHDAESPPPGPGLLGAIKSAASQWSMHKSAKTGAALAYYSIFSIGPLIVVVIAIAGLIFDRQGAQAEVVSAIRGLLGDKGAEAINGMLASAGKPSEGLFASIIGTATLVFAALGVVVQLKEALNTVWDVRPRAGGGAWAFVRTHVFSLAGVLALGFLMLISMLLTAGLAAIAKVMGSVMPEAFLQAAAFLVSFGAISVLFALMFHGLPDAPVAWRDVWLGAIATAGLFEIGKVAIGFYIGKQGLESTYGASASIVVVLIWVYYSAQIVLFGAEFTRARHRQRMEDGAREPSESRLATAGDA
jgi:membrane protein